MDDPNHLRMDESILPSEGIRRMEKLKELKNIFTGNKKYKNALIGILIALIAILSFAAYKTNEIKTRAFIVYFGDEEIGIIREQEDALNILANIKRELSTTYDIDI